MQGIESQTIIDFLPFCVKIKVILFEFFSTIKTDTVNNKEMRYVQIS